MNEQAGHKVGEHKRVMDQLAACEICIYNTGHIQIDGDRCEQLFKISAEDLSVPARVFAGMLSFGDEERFLKRLRNAQMLNAPFNFGGTIKRQKFRIAAVPTKNGAAKHVGYLMHLGSEDEKDTFFQNVLIETALSNSQLGMLICETDGTLSYLNQTLANWLNVPVNMPKLAGNLGEIFVNEGDKSSIFYALHRGVHYNKAEIDLQNKRGEIKRFVLEGRRQNRHFFITLLDITEYEAKNLTQQNQLKLKALTSQMTPHFIFNSLSTLNCYLMDGDLDKAQAHLYAFSKLSRSVLDNARQERIKLKDEMAFLESYLTLEQARFSDLSFSIQIAQNVDLEDTLVPPMVVQPFVENAIKHGFRSLKKKGNLSIRVVNQKNHLVVEIEDNGIGIGAAKALEKANKNGRMSHAMNITQSRLDLFEALDNLNFDMQVIDKVELDSCTETGTIVTLRFEVH